MCNQDRKDELVARVRGTGIPDDILYDLIHTLGEEGYLDAKPVIEEFLSDKRPEIRGIALNVLTLHWGCQDHRRTCEEFALRDKDTDNRRLGVAALGSLLEGTKDRESLKLLLSIFRNESERQDLRDFAYSSILLVLGRPLTELPPVTRDLDPSSDIDWGLVLEAESIVEGDGNDSDQAGLMTS